MALLVGGFGLQFAVTNPLMASRYSTSVRSASGCSARSSRSAVARNVYSVRRRDPGPLEFLAWALVFGVAECLAAVMPAVWAYDVALVVHGAATQLFAVSATVYLQQATPPPSGAMR